MQAEGGLHPAWPGSSVHRHHPVCTWPHKEGSFGIQTILSLFFLMRTVGFFVCVFGLWFLAFDFVFGKVVPLQHDSHQASNY